MGCNNYIPNNLCLGLIALLVLLLCLSLGCPTDCQCHSADKAVNCYGKQLTRIPANIPLDTEVLDLRNNDIKYIAPLTFQNLTNLTDIMLTYNKISKLDVGTFKDLQNLKIIGLGTNFLSVIPEGLFDNLPSLSSVILTENYLTTLSRIFKSVSQLSRLDLRGNNIQVIKNPDFRQLPNLVDLILTANKISKVDTFAFRPLEKLAYLSLKSNPLKKADRLLNKNRRLTNIDLSTCQLKSVPRGLPNSVQHLQLNQNNITKIKQNDFKNKFYLAILVLDENQIAYIAPNAFSYQKNLKQLWLNDNKLRKFPSPFSQTVSHVFISNNKIEKLMPSDFPRNSLLTELVLNDNNISEWTPKTFQNLAHLKNLWMNSNKMTALHDNSFSNLKNLQLLSLKNNKIQKFEKNCFSGLINLHDLNLASSLVPKVSINGNLFVELKNLRILDLSMSEGLAQAVLKSPEMMLSLQNLSELNLMDNNIVTIEKTTLQQFTNLKKIKLMGNRWHCDQRLGWMTLWLKQNEGMVDRKDEIKCYSPASLRKKKIADLKMTQFLNTTTITMTTDKLEHESRPLTYATRPLLVTTSDTVYTTHEMIKKMTSRKIPSTDTQPSTTKTRTTKNKYVSEISDTFYTMITTDKVDKSDEISTVSTVYDDIPFHKNQNDEISNATAADQPLVADGYKYVNHTKNGNKSNTPFSPEEIDDELQQIETDIGNYNMVVIIIATTLSLLVLFIIIIIIVVICRRREKVVYHRALQYHKENGDVVFFVGDVPQCVATLTTPSRNNSRSRDERGSTSSRPSEDITNELDTTMKIYSLDE